jgi:hypothetical protein
MDSKAPNKIYLAFVNGFVAQSSNEKVDASGSSVFLEGLEPKEYLNKDMFLEWARKEKEDAYFRFDDGDICFGYDLALDEIIKKLESL